MNATLVSADGTERPASVEIGAIRYVVREKRNAWQCEVTYRWIEPGLYLEESVESLVWWSCDRGHGWWGGDSKTEPECFRCKTMARVLECLGGNS